MLSREAAIYNEAGSYVIYGGPFNSGTVIKTRVIDIITGDVNLKPQAKFCY